MALTYGDIGAGVVGGTTPLYASYMNALREGISRRAAQVGAEVVLPDVVVAAGDAHAQMQAWLLKARTAVEVLIPSFYSYDSGAGTFAAWNKATLLAYVHATWVTTAFIADPNNWAPYTPGVENNFYACYFNEIYFALECLCIHDVTYGKGTAVQSYIWHAGVTRPTPEDAFADGWAAALAGGWQAGADWQATAHSQLAFGGGNWSYIAPWIAKVTSAGVVVPDVAYALTDLWVPFNFGGSDPGSVAQILSVPGGTAELANVWEGGYLDTWLRLMKAAGWDNETVSPAYSFDLPSNTYGQNQDEHDWTILMQLVWSGSSAAGYGRSDFGGYSNGKYDPW